MAREIDDIAALLAANYGIRARSVEPVSGGADTANTNFHVRGSGGGYFVKLRRRAPNLPALELARFLAAAGIDAVVAPVRWVGGLLASAVEASHVLVYPWIDGAPATETALSEAHWHAFGRSLRAIHDVALPHALSAALRREAFSSRWREQAFAALADAAPSDPAADVLRANAAAIRTLVTTAGRLGALLGSRPHALVPCHGDIHAANVMVEGGRIRIVDWDDPLLAPRERDLMFIGAGICGVWKNAWEVAAFDAGYGSAAGDPALVAYYRCERVVEDIAVTSADYRAAADDAARQNALGLLRGQFGPGSVADIALQSAALLNHA